MHLKLELISSFLETPCMLIVDFDMDVGVVLDVDTAMVEHDLSNAQSSMLISKRLVQVHVEVQVRVHDDKAVIRFEERGSLQVPIRGVSGLFKKCTFWR